MGGYGKVRLGGRFEPTKRGSAIENRQKRGVRSTDWIEIVRGEKGVICDLRKWFDNMGRSSLMMDDYTDDG